MGSDNIKVITDTSFDQDVMKSETPVLIDFWATWCGPCRTIAPMIDAIADQYAGKLTVGKVDIDREPISAQQLGITSIPTLLLFRGGKVVWKYVGVPTRGKLDAELKTLLE